MQFSFSCTINYSQDILWHTENSQLVFPSQNMWLGMLHHIVNEHRWAFGECDHEELDEPRDNKQWLAKGSVAHDKQRELVMAKRFMNTWIHYVNFKL